MDHHADILRGISEIRGFINQFLVTPWTSRQTYAAIAKGEIPAGKFMGKLCASKTAIKAKLDAAVVGASH